MNNQNTSSGLLKLSIVINIVLFLVIIIGIFVYFSQKQLICNLASDKNTLLNSKTNSEYLKIPEFTKIPKNKIDVYHGAMLDITIAGAKEINGSYINQPVAEGYIYYIQPKTFAPNNFESLDISKIYSDALTTLEELGMTLIKW